MLLLSLDNLFYLGIFFPQKLIMKFDDLSFLGHWIFLWYKKWLTFFLKKFIWIFVYLVFRSVDDHHHKTTATGLLTFFFCFSHCDETCCQKTAAFVIIIIDQRFIVCTRCCNSYCVCLFCIWIWNSFRMNLPPKL